MGCTKFPTWEISALGVWGWMGGVWSWAGRKRSIKAPEPLGLSTFGIILVFSPKNQMSFLSASKRNSLETPNLRTPQLERVWDVICVVYIELFFVNLFFDSFFFLPLLGGLPGQ